MKNATVNEITIPKWIDMKEFNEWVLEDDEIITTTESNEEGNFIVLLKDNSNSNIRLLRFFNLGKTTHCSVDYNGLYTNRDEEMGCYVHIIKTFNIKS